MRRPRGKRSTVLAIALFVASAAVLFKKELAKHRRRQLTVDSVNDHRGWSLFRDPKSIVFKDDPKLAEEYKLYDVTEDQKHMAISRLHHLIYVHIPKTGGTTVESSNLFQDHRFYTAYPCSSHYRLSQILENAQQRLISNYVTSTTVRHPGQRFISSFYYVKYDKVQSDINHNTYKYHTTRFGIHETKTVTEFVHKLNSNPGMWHDLLTTFPHFVPMTPYVILDTDDQKSPWDPYSGTKFGIDVVMCQEQWNEGLQRLHNAIGVSQRGDINDESLFKVLNPSSASTSLSWMTLSRDVQDSILNNYAMDTCLFGYNEKYTNEKYAFRSDQCIGSVLTRRDQFTERFSWCKERINQEE